VAAGFSLEPEAPAVLAPAMAKMALREELGTQAVQTLAIRVVAVAAADGAHLVDL
jgi:hypothetical protein